jgi:hypothetical protein
VPYADPQIPPGNRSLDVFRQAQRRRCPGAFVRGPFPFARVLGPAPVTINDPNIRAGDTILLTISTFVPPVSLPPVVTVVGDGFFTAVFNATDNSGYSYWIVRP